MNPIVTHATAHHVDDVARHGGLDVGWAAVVEGAGHDANRAAIHERFSDVPVVKHDGAVHGGNA